MERDRLTLTVNEAARILGISRGLAYEMVKIGEIPAIRFGKRWVVPRLALEHMLEESGAVDSRGQEPSSASKSTGTATITIRRRRRYGESC